MSYKSITGKTFRPVLALIFGLTVRLLCRILTQVPMAEGSLWHVPENLPVLFAKPETSNVFFSARVLVATVFMCESIYSFQRLMKHHSGFDGLQRTLMAIFSVLLFSYNIVLSLSLKASWSFDIMIAILVARLSTVFAYRLAPFID